MAGFDLVVADACWNWTQRLFSPLAQRGANILLLRASDWRTARGQRRPWRDWTFPQQQLGPGLWSQTLVLPPGWMKTYPRVGMRPISWSIRAWRQKRRSARPLVLAISYPHYLHLARQVQPDALVYYNMDDYSLYWPHHAASIQRLEHSVVEQADLSVFCAQARANRLANEVPQAAGRIVHLPHGSPGEWLSPTALDQPLEAPADLATIPRPYLGFIGSLEDRLDWPLLERLARSNPDGSLILIGRAPTASDSDWFQQYERVAALPNVHLLGWRPQHEIGRYMAAFDVCLIPYLTQHAFNRAACPTKIMDYMASTRPVVSTTLPECTLYDHLFEVASDHGGFVDAVHRILAIGSNDGRAEARWRHARGNTWDLTADRLLELLLDRWGGTRRDP